MKSGLVRSDLSFFHTRQHYLTCASGLCVYAFAFALVLVVVFFFILLLLVFFFAFLNFVFGFFLPFAIVPLTMSQCAVDLHRV